MKYHPRAMLVAALDTATLTLSCALAEVRPDGVERVAEKLEHAPARPSGGALGGHSARLPSSLVDLLDAAGRKLSDVEGYAIGLGPGSFTGLRIGLATWKGLAYANQRPIAGASSLAAMALAAAERAEPGALLVPLLDARKGEVYAGFYRVAASGVEAVAPEAALAPAALLERVAVLPGAEQARAFGEGYEAYAASLSPPLRRLDTDVATPPALGVVRLCAAKLLGAHYEPQALFALEPHYVRASEAELKFPGGLGPGAKR
jgi:tRNA threonylcarbamoyladenosine biosynthesis protein TsaB